MFDYEIPILHPLMVHFPIAFILAGTAALLGWAISRNPFWYRVGALAYLAGLLAAFAAYLTGEAAEDAAEDVPIVEELVHLHEDLALYTLGAAVVILVALAAANPGLIWPQQTTPTRSDKPLVRWGLVVLGLVAAALVAWTSHIGGLMVWGVPK
jgi:uncharacterized membrane protein